MYCGRSPCRCDVAASPRVRPAFLGDARGADISDDGVYRYRLWRRFDSPPQLLHPMLHFIMLNPSTADASTDDATIRKCIAFAKRLGYGGIVVTNLYAYRATEPADLKAAGYPVGPDNDRYIVDTVKKNCGITVAAWGTKATPSRENAVIKLMQACNVRLYALKTTKHGKPAHPLYLRGDTYPKPWTLEPV